jgi:hypothetical protein
MRRGSRVIDSAGRRDIAPNIKSTRTIMAITFTNNIFAKNKTVFNVAHDSGVDIHNQNNTFVENGTVMLVRDEVAAKEALARIAQVSKLQDADVIESLQRIESLPTREAKARALSLTKVGLALLTAGADGATVVQFVLTNGHQILQLLNLL